MYAVIQLLHGIIKFTQCTQQIRGYSMSWITKLR